MKILYLIDYFYPFSHGGSEWSLYYLMQSLLKKGFKISVITPNFGTVSKETWKKISINRHPFLIKLLKNNPTAVSPYWFNNFIFIFISTIYLLFLIRKLKPEVIHLQGHYYLPAALIAKLIFGLPVIVTIRDYQILCPFGFCLNPNNKFLKCDGKRFFKEDLKYYLSNYHKQSSLLKRFFIVIASFRVRLVNYLYRWLLKKVNKIVCISKKQQTIFNINGFKNTEVIYNSVAFPKTNKKILKEQIIYIGRLTPGKGIEVLLQSCVDILREDKKLKLLIIGQGFLNDQLRKRINSLKIGNQVILTGQLGHNQVLEILQQSKLCVVPSCWEEPFGRVALEAQACGVPVVASDKGGLPEIVENGVTGYVTQPDKVNLTKAIRKALKNNFQLRKNIRKQKNNLYRKFNLSVTYAYCKLYKSL